MLFSTVWLGKKNRGDRKQGRKFSLLGPLFLGCVWLGENREDGK